MTPVEIKKAMNKVSIICLSYEEYVHTLINMLQA